jgi:tape measure domain-containing protein
VATTTQTIKVEIDDRQAQRALGGLTQALAALGGLNFASNLAQQFVKIASDAQEMTNKLVFATGGVDTANQAFRVLADTAKRTGSNLGGTVDLFQKLAMSSTFAGSSTESLALITENFNKTLKISGTSGAGAASALYQFAQAMQKGTLNGDEFRTIMETNGYLLKVLEQQTGKSRSELISMASSGRLSAEIVGKALLETTMIADDYGKVTQGLPAALENFNTSVTQAVKALDEQLGITKLLTAGLEFLSNNIGAVIGGLAGITVAVIALTAALVPAAALVTILTGGLALLAAAGVGAAIGLAAQEASNLANNTGEVNQSQAETNRLAQSGLKISKQRNQQALDLDKNIEQTIAQLKAQNAIESRSTGLRSLALEVEKEVAKEREKYKKTGEAISPQLERELVAETRKKILLEETNSTKRRFLDLQSSILVAGQQDAGQRQILNGLEQFRLSVTAETYNKYKQQYQTLLQTNLQAQALVDINGRLRESQIQVNSLGIRDLDVREQQQAVDGERLRLGSLFTTEMESQVRATVKNNQAVKELLATEQQRALLQGAATSQTKAQQIDTATGAIGRLDPRLSAEQQYQTELAALKNTEFTSEQQRMEMLELLSREHSLRMHEINKQRSEADLRLAGVTNQGIIDAVRQGQDNIRLMQQGGVQAVMGSLNQMSLIFNQLGAHNKKAFAAAKAFNIANAVMNTYMGATKALATYPPPFNFILAAGVVATGLAQVAQIRSQQYSGREKGGPIAAGMPYIVGEAGPEIIRAPSGGGTVIPNDQIGGGGAVNINFTINAVDATGIDELLYDRREVIKGIISDAMLEKGQRF